jgi:hypothetical protein
MKTFKNTRTAVFVSILGAATLVGSQVQAAPVQPLAPLAPGVQAANRIIYVKDFSHLADLTAADAAVQAKATELARWRLASNAVAIGGPLLGAALTLGGMFLGGQSCNAQGSCTPELNAPVMWSGVGLMSISTIVAFAIRPSRRDLLDLVNDWNSRHPNEPFTVDSQPEWGGWRF